MAKLGQWRSRVGAAAPHLWPDREHEPSPRVAVGSAGCDRCDIRSRAICASLTDDELRLLERAVTPIHVEANAVLVNEGDDAERIYTVMRGMLRMVRYLPDGRRQIVDFLAPGDFTGIPLGGAHEHSLEAVVNSRLCSIGRVRLQELGRSLPHLQDRLLAFTCRDLQRARDLQVSLGRRMPVEKVATFLLELARRAERLGEAPAVVALPMTRNDIADHLGLTIETVSRTFTRLRQQGVIGLPASHLVELRQRIALEALAGRCP